MITGIIGREYYKIYYTILLPNLNLIYYNDSSIIFFNIYLLEILNKFKSLFVTIPYS